jgi:hypothetical protein
MNSVRATMLQMGATDSQVQNLRLWKRVVMAGGIAIVMGLAMMRATR